ncbi:hypothetical protein [Halocola ammonii]
MNKHKLPDSGYRVNYEKDLAVAKTLLRIYYNRKVKSSQYLK